MACDIDLLRPLKATLDLVIDLRGTLTQVGPALGILEIAMFVGAFRCPYDTGGGTGGVKTSVRLVAFMGAELAMDLGGELWWDSLAWWLTGYAGIELGLRLGLRGWRCCEAMIRGG
jgi:hypothetical protein